MEVELFSNVISEEDTVEVDVEIDNFGVEGERCGICMDIVVDRGVLDSCQHWFCFACIDSWATIANLCPLCQHEFQLITCVPVYDTIGDGKTDEDLDLRYDDWCVEEKNNTHSFPSYYIDENAVACLDGDGCKIRNESVTSVETLTCDTSIACDSCHIWHHAFCVGFDPENADVDSWLCPRCLVNDAQQKSDFREAYRTVNLLKSESADCRRLANTCSGIKASQIEPTFPPAKPRECSVESESNESGSTVCLNLGTSLDANLSKDNKTKIQWHRNECLHNASGKSSFMDAMLKDVKSDLPPKIGEKRKYSNNRELNCSRDRGKRS